MYRKNPWIKGYIDLIIIQLVIVIRNWNYMMLLKMVEIQGKKIKKKGTKAERTPKRNDSKTESTGGESSDSGRREMGMACPHVQPRAWEIVGMRCATDSEDYEHDECGWQI
ncbi:hypothetical protein PIB30_008218 [Stylosanthes scabra]|uniref:Uncharacterized protein n=1 Tax=Stylosanthes scabra TaxID=79078 RepID=A0ABU6Q4S6_9FABA|nr:hypothetical protein [Stylosanthes scabra]